MDLIMFPGDASFRPYTGKDASPDSDNVTSPTSGRVFVLKFSSSSQRHLFWLQSPSQHPDKQKNWFSPRDLKLGQIIDLLLSGEDVDVAQELAEIESANPDADDAEDGGGLGTTTSRMSESNTGGAGSGATGGDIREEGEGPREGGADGGRAASSSAPTDASALVQNLLNSLQGGSTTGTASPSQQRSSQHQQKPFCSLADLLTPETCIPVIQAAPSSYLDTLLSQLPASIILLETSNATTTDTPTSTTEPTPAAAAAAIASMPDATKRNVLTRVIRSPQLRQSLGSLTAAIREGGLPTVAEALAVKVANGGLVRGGAVPLGGSEAVQAFVHGVRATVEAGEEDVMDTA